MSTAEFWNKSLYDLHTLRHQADKVGSSVQTAGRVVSFRKQGGIAFGHIADSSGQIQFCLQKKIVGEDRFKEWCSQIKIGVHIGIEGKIWVSSTGEQSILVDTDFKLLQDCWKGFPDKVVGFADPEQKVRKRYLDAILDPSTSATIKLRAKTISLIRSWLNDLDFMEVETPILCSQASGAQARPFTTHHNALDAELFLRIAPETYLKRVVAGGFDNVFEIGKNFRNEGIDPSHLQEFTSLEWYSAYVTATGNLTRFKLMLVMLKYNTNSTSDIFSESRIVKYRDLFMAEVGQAPEAYSATEADNLFKKNIRPKLVGPTYVTDYPAHLAPMAARKVDDPTTVDMWQFIYNGWEVAKCYTELTDPVLQRQLLVEQAQEKAAGNDEAMALEEDFLEAMEYGMPPMSGLGVGIDRLVALMDGKTSLKDVVFFPTMLRNPA